MHRPHFPNWTLSGYFSGWKGHLFWLIDFSRPRGELISYTDDCLFPRLCVKAVHLFLWHTECAHREYGQWAVPPWKDLDFAGKNTLVGPSGHLYVDHNEIFLKAFCMNAAGLDWVQGARLCRGHLWSTLNWDNIGPEVHTPGRRSPTHAGPSSPWKTILGLIWGGRD